MISGKLIGMLSPASIWIHLDSSGFIWRYFTNPKTQFQVPPCPICRGQTLTWLVVWTPLKNISQLGWLFPIYGKIKNVPNRQPVTVCWFKPFTHLETSISTLIGRTPKEPADFAADVFTPSWEVPRGAPGQWPWNLMKKIMNLEWTPLFYMVLMMFSSLHLCCIIIFISCIDCRIDCHFGQCVNLIANCAKIWNPTQWQMSRAGFTRVQSQWFPKMNGCILRKHVGRAPFKPFWTHAQMEPDFGCQTCQFHSQVTWRRPKGMNSASLPRFESVDIGCCNQTQIQNSLLCS